MMALVTVIAVSILRSVSQFVADYYWLVILALLAYPPLHRTTFTGQNAAISLLCVAGIYAASRQHHKVLGGVWLGFLMFKPQLAIPMLLLFIWRREWRTVAATGVTGGLLGAISAVIAGPLWPRDMFRFVTSEYYQSNELECCGWGNVSLSGAVAKSIGDDALIIRMIVGAIALVTIVVVARMCRHAATDDANFSLQFGLAISTAMFLSPHSLFYDTTILVVAVVALVDAWRSANGSLAPRLSLTDRQRLFLIGIYTCGFLWPAFAVIRFQPAALIPPAVGIAVWSTLRTRANALSAPATNRNLAGLGAPAD
jgi:hypothetical protein